MLPLKKYQNVYLQTISKKLRWQKPTSNHDSNTVPQTGF